MAQYISHETRHPERGKWGCSRWTWHRLEWLLDGDGGVCDGASACDRYLSPPYLDEPPDYFEKQSCAKCLKAPIPPAVRDVVQRAYERVRDDRAYQFGYRLSPGVTELDESGKLMFIRLYEQATGKILLPVDVEGSWQ